MAQYNKARAAAGRKNALKTSNFLMLSTPRYTTNIFRSQNKKKVIAGPVSRVQEVGNTTGKLPRAGNHILSIRNKELPPIQVWMPNQPQATIARKSAGILAPRTPKLARAIT